MLLGRRKDAANAAARERAGLFEPPSAIENAFRSTDVASVFIDADCRVWNYTPLAGRLFNIRDTDMGRKINDLRPFARNDDLVADVAKALRTSEPIEKIRQVEGSSRVYSTTILPYTGEEGSSSAAVLTFMDITTLRAAERQVARFSNQQKKIADFTQRVTQERDLYELMDEAARIIAATLDVDCVKVLELLPGGNGLLLRAGLGWGEESVGREIVRTGTESQAGYALTASDLVTVSDLSRETRFSDRPLLKKHKVLSGISCTIRDHEGNPCGVLGAHSRVKRRYTEEETRFLQAMAAILGYAIYRDRIEAKLDSLTTSFESQVKERTQSLEQQRELTRRLSSELIVGEQRERRRIARELHDHLAQLLLVGKMKIGQVEHASLDARQSELLGEVQDCLDQALRYTRDLIPEISPTMLYDFGLTKAIEWLGDKMGGYGLRVDVDTRLPDDSAEFSEPAAILLFQVIRELLFNVLKHAGVEAASISVDEPEPGKVRFTVTDAGAGFDVDAALRVAPKPDRLGLLNVMERVESLGGQLDIRSDAGEGTQVSFTVPTNLVTDRDSDPSWEDLISAPLEPPGEHVSAAADATRVLIADDQALFRQELRGLLNADPGIEVIGEAVDGADAIEACRKLHPDVVLMDINMPVLDGIEATRAIKSTQPAVYVIGLSMQSDDIVRDAFADANGDRYVSKGECLESVFEMIRNRPPNESL